MKNIVPFLMAVCLAMPAFLGQSQSAPAKRKPASLPAAPYSSDLCGISFEHDARVTVKELPLKDNQTEVCLLAEGAVVSAPTDGYEPQIQVVKGSLKDGARAAGFEPDPKHSGGWTYKDVTGDVQVGDEKNERWTGLAADYSVRMSGENGYEGMGDAEMLVACNGRERCVIFDSESLGLGGISPDQENPAFSEVENCFPVQF
ncbi:MAG TPA: hypothetical protein VKH81_17605 [Candidatus Angelobacter sp.]|nr:hypothetical protein [Candidatus Angelobacter sp.]